MGAIGHVVLCRRAEVLVGLLQRDFLTNRDHEVLRAMCRVLPTLKTMTALFSPLEAVELVGDDFVKFVRVVRQEDHIVGVHQEGNSPACHPNTRSPPLESDRQVIDEV